MRFILYNYVSHNIAVLLVKFNSTHFFGTIHETHSGITFILIILMDIILILCVQFIYSLSDLGKKIALGSHGFQWTVLKNPLFIIGILAPIIGLVLQIYVFSKYELARSIIILGMFAIIFATILGVLVLKERFTFWNYIGVVFAILAIILVKHK